MKKIFLFGILAFLILTVTYASAASTEYYLTSSNENSNEHIYVKATYDQTNGELTLEDSSGILKLNEGYTLDSSSGILAVGFYMLINEYIDATTKTPYVTEIDGFTADDNVKHVLYSPDGSPKVSTDVPDWEYGKGPNNYGTFKPKTTYGKSADENYKKVIVYFNKPGPDFASVVDKDGHYMGVHYRLVIPGLGFPAGSTFFAVNGPKPVNPSLSLVKEISSNEKDWVKSINVDTGSNVYYKFTVKNTGDVDLTDIKINDPNVDTSKCTFTNPLIKGESSFCIVGPITAAEGSHTNTATASGKYAENTYNSNQDSATYIAKTETQVPEFPSLALPVASIIGILFIFGRRKKE